MTSITTRDTGETEAEIIVFYHGESELCLFWNVVTNQEIACSVQLSVHSELGESTKYSIFYRDNTECNGSLNTSCSLDIYNRFGDGECDKLQVVGWEDINGHLCPQNIL